MSGGLLEGGQIFSAMQSRTKSRVMLHLKEVENINLNVGQCSGGQIWIMDQGSSSPQFWLSSGVKAKWENGFSLRNLSKMRYFYFAFLRGPAVPASAAQFSCNASNCRPELRCQNTFGGQYTGFFCFPLQRAVCSEHCLIAGLPASSVSVLRPLGNAVTMKWHLLEMELVCLSGAKTTEDWSHLPTSRKATTPASNGF